VRRNLARALSVPPAGANDLCQPLPIVAILLLAGNDHVGKGLLFLPEIVRGKLSDVAGLFFFPIFLFALVGLASRRLVDGHRQVVAWLAAVATGLAFGVLKTQPEINRWAGALWGPAALDPTDLLALPAALLAAVWLLRRPGGCRPRPAWARFCVLAMAAFFSIATPAPMMARRFPEWRVVRGDALALACAKVHAWISKSGKEGLGVTLRLTATASCVVAVREARLVVDGHEVPAVAVPPEQRVGVGAPVHVYLPFSFDGEGAWNRGARTARLKLAFELVGAGEGGGTAPVAWDLPLEFHLDSQHAPRRRPACEGSECATCPH
jgi:hypothetical protein